MSCRSFLALVASELLIAVVLSVMLPVGALGASCGRQWVTASWYGTESGATGADWSEETAAR